MRGKSLLRLTGKVSDITRVLQGLVTADVSRLSTSTPLAAALLTNKGRVIADCTLMQHEDAVLLHTDESLLPTVKRLVSTYKLRTPIDLQIIYTSVKWSASAPASCSVLHFPDPRCGAMGFWTIDLNEQLSSRREEDDNDDDYNLSRVLHGVSEGREIVGEIPLECNLDFLNAISFTKGCYLGQELVARTKFKGVVRKRIVPFLTETSIKTDHHRFDRFQKLEGRIEELYQRDETVLDISKDSKVVCSEGEVGEVVYFKEGRGLAKMRLDVLLKSPQLRIGERRVLTHMPQWWPETDPATQKSIFDGIS